MTLAISWSGLQRWEHCKQHHLRVMERRSIPRARNTRDFLPGTLSDRIMRAWLQSPDPQPGQMVEMVPEFFDRFTNPDRGEQDFSPVSWKGDPRRDQEEVRRFVSMVVTNLEPILTKWVIPFDYQPELKFETVIGIPYLDGRTVGIKLIGGIDIVVRIQRDPPVFILFDLKATKNDSYIAKTLGQGIFYDISWASYFKQGYPARFGFIAPALNDQLIWADITDEDRRVMMSRVIAFAQGMWRGDWAPKVDNEGCDFCTTKHVCDKFAVHLVKDADGRNRVSFEDAIAARRAVPAPESGPEATGGPVP